MATLVIVGPGAVGGTVADALIRAGRHDLTLAARTAFDVLRVESPGAVHEARPRVITREEDATVADWVLVATKAYDVSGAAVWLRRLCDDQTRVAVLQNGIEHVERFAPFVPRHRIVPVVVDCPAERVAPGWIRSRRRPRLIVGANSAGNAFASLFDGTEIEVGLSRNLEADLWRKLCINSAGALSALACKAGPIATYDGIADAMRGVMRECIAVARAGGVVLDDSLADDCIRGLRSAAPNAMSSICADRIAGRRMEIDARNGVIVRLGRERGVPTPLNAMIVALLEVIEADLRAASR